MKKVLVFIFFTITVLLLSACSASGPEISVTEAWVRPDPLWENASGYFMVTNEGSESDYLIGISADFTMMESLHHSVMEGEVHKMLPVDRLEIPAGGRVSFQPLSYHAMLMKIDDEMAYGEMVTLVLEFEKSGEISVEAELRSE
ncbi:MAG: copper chaperone PCu(A)C [Chloroflexota bacterium]